MIRQLLKKTSSDAYVLGFMISCALAGGTFVGVRKLVYDPDIQILRRNKPYEFKVPGSKGLD
jgi:hypothetical protein